MSSRSFPAFLLAAGLLLATALAPAVAEPPDKPAAKKTKHHAHPRLVTATYAVADLVVPLDNPGGRCLLEPAAPSKEGTTLPQPIAVAPTESCPQATAPTCASTRPTRTLEDQLIKLITTNVAPQTWGGVGGAGSIDYYPLGMALVVNQTPDVQEQVAELLAALRRLQDLTVAVEVRFVTTSEPFFERLGVDFNVNLTGAEAQPHAAGDATANSRPAGDLASPAPRLSFLNDREARRLLEAVQGDQRTNVMQAPKLTLANGQSGTINVTDLHYFLTGINAVQVGDQVAYTPKTEAVPLGLRMSVQPVVSADRRYVNLNLKINQTDLAAGAIPLMPVTTPVKPADGDEGGHGKSVAFTQFLQQPTLNTVAVDQTLTIPDGGTALLSGWTRVTETRNESGAPVLSKVPYVNRLFKTVGYGRETQQVLVLVTPRIIVSEEEEKQSPERKTTACLCPKEVPGTTAGGTEEEEHAPRPEMGPRQRKVGMLLEKYHQACATGDLPLAKKLAVRALLLDPACFNKERPAAGR